MLTNKKKFLTQITAMKFGPVRGMYRGPGVFAASRNTSGDPKLQDKVYLFATSHTNGAILLWDTTGLYLSVLKNNNVPITDLVFTPRKMGLIQLMSVDLDGGLLVSHIIFSWNSSILNICVREY